MYKILVYGFPLILLIFEWGLRSILNVDTSGFTGPTLTAAALTMLVPLSQPKKLDMPIDNVSKAIVISKNDSEYFIPIVWIFIFAYLFLWETSCFYSIKHPLLTIIGIPTHFFIGLITYVVSLIMVVIKEKV